MRFRFLPRRTATAIENVLPSVGPGLRLSCNDGRFWRKREGWGVFVGNFSYVIDGVGVGGWLPGVFCALLLRFLRRFGEGCAE